jgi:aminoglycoside phosphotransferase (APT) family kinase protein
MSTSATREGATAAQRVLVEVNRAHSTRFRLSGRPVGGVHDAWLLDAPDGTRAVLKTSSWSLGHLRRVASVVEELRTRGYPTPRWLLTGAVEGGPTYHVQDFVPGELPVALTVPLARLMVDLLEFTAGFDVWPERDLSADVTEHFASCAEALHRTAPATRRIVEVYERLVEGLGRVELPRGDFVHGDFHRYNVLLDQDRVTGVIDIEACGGGTRVIDYAWLLRDSYLGDDGDPEVRQVIRRAGEAVAGPEVLAFCVSVAALDNLRWRAHNRAQKVPAMLVVLERLAGDLVR